MVWPRLGRIRLRGTLGAAALIAVIQSPAGATKPEPPIAARWEAGSAFLPGARVTAHLVVTVARPMDHVRVTILPGPAALLVVRGALEFEGGVAPEEPLRLPFEIRIPEHAGPVLEARVITDSPGATHRVTAALDLAPVATRPSPALLTGVPSREGFRLLERLSGGDAIPAFFTPAPGAAPALPVTMSGRCLYRDRVFGPDGFLHDATALDPLLPVRFASVELMEDAAVVAASVTDTSGGFRFDFEPQPGASYRVRVLSLTGAWGGTTVRVRTSSGSTNSYSVLSTSFLAPGEDVTLPDLVAEPGVGEAFNILDACLEGVLHVQGLSGSFPPATLTIFWNATSTTGTYFRRDQSAIYLLADEGYDDCVVLHEFGHYVLWNFSKDESPGGAHYVDDSEQDPRLAWSEGFASYFQNSVRARRGDPYASWYVDTNGTPGAGQLYFSYEAEGPGYYVRGAGSEVAVEAVLWDIEDGAEIPGDPAPDLDDDLLDLPVATMWEVITVPMRFATTISLEDFWEGWFDPSVDNGHLEEMQATFGALDAEYFPDAFEPGDAGAGTALSAAGAPIHRTLYPAQDEDVFTLDLEAGVPVLIETFNLLGFGDTFLEVSGPESTWVNDNRSPSELGSEVRFTPESSGSYGIRVRRSKSTFLSQLVEFGSYDVRAVAGAPGGTFLTVVGGSGGASDAGFGVGTAAADYDGDGRPDLMVVNNGGCGPARGMDALFRNDGGLSFTNQTAAAGLGAPEGGIAAAWGDYDGDGDPDLFLSDHGLYRNEGGLAFVDVTAASGVVDLGREFDAAWVDANVDGLLDLFVVGREEPSRLWRNEGNGVFTDVAGTAGFDFPENGGSAAACAWGDADQDGLPDLFLALDASPGHALYRNLGENTFQEVTGVSGVASEVGATGAAWGDVDGDGRLDLFVASVGPDKLYLNQGGFSFVESAASWGVNDADPAATCGFLDADLDGDLDLYTANVRAPSRLYLNTGSTLVRTPDMTETGIPFGAAFGDLDGDGDPEIYQARGCDVTQCPSSCQANRLYRNDAVLAGSPHWLGVRLEGTLSNRDGLGARVSLHVGGGVVHREMGAGSGWASKSLLPVVLGLGPLTAVDSVEVFWPSGVRDVVFAPEPDTVVSVKESGKTPVVPSPGEPTLSLLLRGPSPNPFRGGTAMLVELNRPADVIATVVDVTGRRVRTLLARRLEAGSHLVGWDGEDDGGRSSAAGLYFYRVEAEGRLVARKLLRLGP